MNTKTLYLGGGCFWGLQGYLKKIKGIVATETGYANGTSDSPTYTDVCNGSGHVEAVKVTYDTNRLSLSELILYFLRAIDPFSINRQGNDTGIQYRSGIYYEKEEDGAAIRDILSRAEQYESQPFAIEVLPLHNYVKAEPYHQDYLEHNPDGYCHIPLSLADEPLINDEYYNRPDPADLQRQLSKESYYVTQENGTDAPFSHAYTDEFRPGIYVDVTSGEPLFISSKKFESHCGWPSFTKPIAKDVVRYYKDTSHGMNRIEVRSRIGDAHLGHVFEDGPDGQLRYCINGSALRFIPLSDMNDSGYADLIPYVKAEE